MAHDDEDFRRARAVPSGRMARFGAFGRLAGGVAGNVLAQGARKLASGERPQLRDLLLTPGNAKRLTDQLSSLRGAAMKLGQMISMDAGDMLPAELTEIMARLRDRAYHMPPAQLNTVLTAAWGPQWRQRVAHFEAHPLAAASIGQVHRATRKDGRILAVKVQYPGVRESIDADVDNVATLLRLSGLLPREIDIAPLLREAKRQLHEEADYLREAEQMGRYANLLADNPRFVIPAADPALTTERVLAMDFIESVPIERLESAPQADRDQAMAQFIGLVLRELFTFGFMQTDPNFANFRYQPESGRLVLLDFGAARPVDPAAADGYRRLVRAGLEGDRAAVRQASLDVGFLKPAILERHGPLIDRMIDVILHETRKTGLFDFGDRAFVGVLREQGAAVAADREAWHIPPAETLFLQRKISGTALLAARLKARVDVRGLAEPFV
ncbi:ABC1 kinase family protein [Sphingobium algorifonticola]|uniref:AarF/ABC1/UbiB kinase family protein n=1 Tax=Sphingobium algorifonticola TaxID=2008318 RepID=A0A437J8I9_9SPHN|nr:AarF/ABC1/UbiB kinase family protein [Sphingobium algorifonticola]RVT41817.1 AarF/ABC1/UbiB kinase family protein [Sphingobium algorifonticola]